MKVQSGFTFIELIIVIGIISVLLAIGYLSIGSIQRTATSSASVAVIISDIKAQQIKSMTGDTEGAGSPDTFGVKVLTDSYILFRGSVYNPADTSNFLIPAPTGYTLSTTFPDDTIVFSKGPGEVVGFINGQNTITLTNTASSSTKTAHFNKYGTVTNIN